MKTVYIYALETLADWEIAHLIAELNSRRFFKKNAEELQIKYVGSNMSSIKTMGGLSITPDCIVAELPVSNNTFLIMAGADTWNDEANYIIVEKAGAILDDGGIVCGICGATVALATAGILDERKHTSNGVGFLDMFVPTYKGKDFYVDEQAIKDGNLITAAATGAIKFAEIIFRKLDVMNENALSAWYEYFSTGKAQAFYSLMQAVSV